MEKERKKRNLLKGLLLAGGLMTIVAGSQCITHIVSGVWGAKEDQWTPMRMAESLDQTRDVFRLFIAGKELSEHLEAGTLKGVQPDGSEYDIVAKDVRVQLNHAPETRYRYMMFSVIPTFFFGMGLGFLFMGLVFRARNVSTPSES